MADRSISVAVKGDVQQFQAAMASASQSVRGFSGNVAQMARDNRQEMTTVGTAAAGAGLAIAAGLGMGVKAAIDWESAFAGVIKTVDATDAELDALEQGLRDMATEIPVAHEELAGIAEAAGQLGIETPNILGFTETMAALGSATNLTSTEAATMFARFANITGLPQDQFENLGSAVVDLGNNLATTESEIAEMALRIAGAGTQIGLTEPEILGFAGALSSVGIEAQAGGTAISRVFVEIDKAVRSGGDTLDTFAATAGLSVEEFTRAYEQDAAGAIVTFIEGLGGISAAGGDVFGVLESLELQDIRVRDALLRAAGAGDLFRESIDRSSGAFEDNTALSEEAAQRYETVASQIQIAKNALFELGITIGDIVLPALIPVIEGVKNLAEWFSNLPEPVQTAGVLLAGVSGTLLTIGGTALIIVPRIIALVDAWKKLSAAMAASKAIGATGMLPTPTVGGGGIGAAGALGTGAAVVGAGVAVGLVAKEGADLANDIGQANQDLASNIADLMLAAEAGDQDAAQRLSDFQAAFIDNQGFFAKNVNFMGEEFIANRAWLTAQEMIENGEVVLSDFNDEMAGSGSSAAEFEVGMQGAAGAMDGFAQSAEEAAGAHQELIGIMNEALSPISAAIGAVDRMQEAEANLEAIKADSESTTEDVAAAQWAYVESLYAAEGALTAIDPSQLETAVEGIATALDITTEEAFALLESLDLLDGKQVESYVTTHFSTVGVGGVTVAAPGTVGGVPTGRAGGGPVFAGVPYRMGEGNLPEILTTRSGMTYVIPGEHGDVWSNRQVERLMASGRGGGTTIQITQNWPQGERVENATRRGLSSASFLRAAS